VRWQHFDDSLTLRATAGQGFKQATLVELNRPSSSFAIDLIDPVTGRFANGVAVTILQNPDLQAEDSRNVSAGIVYSPKFIRGLTATIDLFNIETTGYIDPAFDFTGTLLRVAAGNPLGLESATRDAEGNLVAFTTSLFNAGTQKARGADFALQYQTQTAFGTFSWLAQATFLDSFQFSSVPGGTERELRSRPIPTFSATHYFSSRDAYLKWRGPSRLDWSWQGLSLSGAIHYRDGFHEFLPNGNEHWVRQTWLFDLQASDSFNKPEREAAVPELTPIDKLRQALGGTTVPVGCRNLFDHDPPESVGNYPRFIYDPTGRFIYAGLSKKF
jgi:outer membrane receptor protein involved in Fe transport